MSIDWSALERVAQAALPQAYAPYSGFRVAAAVQGADGRIFSGVNVENASYGLSVCAERNAIGAAVTAGCRELVAIYVLCEAPSPATPCGACRQVIAEFSQAALVRCRGTEGPPLELSAAELLPAAFKL